MLWNINFEGRDHINIYSRSFSKLGRALATTNDKYPVRTTHGVFNSLDAYYYWLCGGMNDDKYFTLDGFDALALFKENKIKNNFATDKQNFYYAAVHDRIMQHQEIIDMILESGTLPIVAYIFKGDIKNPEFKKDMSRKRKKLLAVIEKAKFEIFKKRHNERSTM